MSASPSLGEGDSSVFAARGAGKHIHFHDIGRARSLEALRASEQETGVPRGDGSARLMALCVLSLGVCGILAGCQPTSNGADMPDGARDGSAATPGTILLSAFWWPLPPVDLVQWADAGVEGFVVDVSEPRWSTPTGDAPAGWSPGATLPEPVVIFREVTVSVTSTLFGDIGGELHVAVLGGGRDGARLAVDEGFVPEMAPGDQVMLFVMHPPAGWRLGEGNFELLQGYVVKDGTAIGMGGQEPIAASELRDQVVSEFRKLGGQAPAPGAAN